MPSDSSALQQPWNDRTVAYCYVRVSEPRDDASGRIEGQIAELARAASEWRIEADRYYADRGVWLYEGNSQRPPQEQVALGSLFADVSIDRRPNRVMFALRVDRFCRSRAKGEVLWERATHLGVQFRTFEEGLFPLTDEGRVAWLDLCGAAEEEVYRGAVRTRQGMAAAHEAGRESGRPPWGLNYQLGRLVIDEETRETAQTILTHLLDLWEPGRIIDSLADDRVWTRRNPSRRTTAGADS